MDRQVLGCGRDSRQPRGSFTLTMWRVKAGGGGSASVPSVTAPCTETVMMESERLR